jgi:hypothetical protein
MGEEHRPSLEDTQTAGTIDARSKGHDIVAAEDDEHFAHWRIEGGLGVRDALSEVPSEAGSRAGRGRLGLRWHRRHPELPVCISLCERVGLLEKGLRPFSEEGGR